MIGKKEPLNPKYPIKRIFSRIPPVFRRLCLYEQLNGYLVYMNHQSINLKFANLQTVKFQICLSFTNKPANWNPCCDIERQAKSLNMTDNKNLPRMTGIGSPILVHSPNSIRTCSAAMPAILLFSARLITKKNTI